MLDVDENIESLQEVNNTWWKKLIKYFKHELKNMYWSVTAELLKNLNMMYGWNETFFKSLQPNMIIRFHMIICQYFLDIYVLFWGIKKKIFHLYFEFRLVDENFWRKSFAFRLAL